MQVNIKNLVDDVQCYQTVRALRWPEGIKCPSCQSKQVMKRGFDDKELARQRYECKGFPEELEKYRAVGSLLLFTQSLTRVARKRTIDESLEKMPSETPKRR